MWPDGWPTLPPWLLPGLAGVSVIGLVLSALFLPKLLAGLPADLFLRPPLKYPWTAKRVLRNVAGASLILAGLAMLVLPGQGVLTALAGVLISDVPGKRRVALALLRRGPVFAAVNAMRRRYDQPPMQLPDPS